MLLQLMMLFAVSLSTKIVSLSSVTILGDKSVVEHTESLPSLGIISTVAGSNGYTAAPSVYDIAATAAKTYNPQSVAVDAAGNFFISTGDHRILKVTASTDLISVVGGTGNSGLSGDGADATAAAFDSPR